MMQKLMVLICEGLTGNVSKESNRKTEKCKTGPSRKLYRNTWVGGFDDVMDVCR